MSYREQSDATTVLLGDIGRALPDSEQLDLGLSRLGGDPIWAKLPSEESVARQRDSLACRKCGRARDFIGQLSASYEGSPSRTLYIFACLAGSCGADDGAWQVLRTTGLPPEQSIANSSKSSSTEGIGDSRECHLGLGTSPIEDRCSSASTLDEPFKNSDWGASEFDTSVSDSDIEALLMTAACDRKTLVKQPFAQTSQSTTPYDASARSGRRGPLTPQAPWPCFSLVIYEDLVMNTSVDNNEKERELLERYRQSELAAGDEAWLRDVQIGTEASQTAAQDIVVGDSDQVEEEEDRQWFIEFQSCLERSPSQVVRYSWGGRPLWITSPPEEASNPSWPPRCGQCGAPRKFEAQLLPTLFYQIRKLCPDRVGDVDIEWGTILIYTCSRDCQAIDPCQEFVLVQPAV
mmetsp:Transcript_50377/g.79864  ORF Transcript_50377/g.79864 Transcript_50377/m.79864 type:complete len:405 (+) Transcript_50377:147-1361(+)